MMSVFLDTNIVIYDFDGVVIENPFES